MADLYNIEQPNKTRVRERSSLDVLASYSRGYCYTITRESQGRWKAV